MQRFRVFFTLVLAFMLLGADAPPLDPDLRAAAPEGLLVTGKSEGIYTWLRFSTSEAIEGEDFRDDAITLYRIEVAVPPAKAGQGMVQNKLEKQEVRSQAQVTLTVEDVVWRGIAAEYVSEAGTARRERYLYTDIYDDTLYIFWDRGPAAGWKAGAPVREETLRKVSAILAGRSMTKPDKEEEPAAEPDESGEPAAEPGESEDS